jgi:hypothetical protein
MTDVEFMVLREQEPLFGTGTLVRNNGDVVVELTASAPSLVMGDVAHVKLGTTAEWLRGHVTRIQGKVVSIQVKSTIREDGRDYPRMFGALDVRMCQANGREEAWMNGEDVGESWAAPDPFMNFSASGLMCSVSGPGLVGGVYLLSLSIPAISSPEWRLTASLIRTTPENDSSNNHEFAMHFLEIPQEATDALVQFTESLLDPEL